MIKVREPLTLTGLREMLEHAERLKVQDGPHVTLAVEDRILVLTIESAAYHPKS